MLWSTKKLGEICDFTFGFSFPAKLFNKENLGLPVIKTGDIRNNFCVHFYDKEYDKRYLVKPGDILIGLSGTIISGRWSGGIALLNQRVVKLNNFLGEVDKSFIFYILPIALKNLERGLWKAAVKNVLKNHLEDLQVCLPSLPEQKKIVYVLDSIREAVKVQDKIIEKTKELKKAMMNEIFNSKLKNQKSKLQFKIQKFAKLKEVSAILMGQSPASSYYNISKIGLPFLQGKAEFGEIYPKVAKWCSNPIKIAEKGDILISVRAPVGDVNLADQKYCIGRGLAAIRSKSNLNNIYLFNYLQISKEKIKNEGTGSTFKAINKSVLENFLIPFPPLDEQREIAEILQTIDRKIEIEEKKKALYEELFRAMLNKIMSGEIKIAKI